MASPDSLLGLVIPEARWVGGDPPPGFWTTRGLAIFPGRTPVVGAGLASRDRVPLISDTGERKMSTFYLVNNDTNKVWPLNNSAGVAVRQFAEGDAYDTGGGEDDTGDGRGTR